ncbi:hypothetical protein FNV43_RR01413 [Rhamnella rubrinervis]|uniref:C2H2-type domain-containing protein n=1 Tax=Rhamnella rubrinervis TaxID=2594499 RepID=A0A8K0HQW8_9ROSA|nr:hypothetical protein FNV43_RR01413 [Rhamnella rubrinervis]
MAAGYGWSLRQGNVQGLNPSQQQQLSAHGRMQIACRLCDRVFLSTQSLIDHIETHMVEDEAASKTRQLQQTNFISSQRDMFATNPFRSTAFPSPTPRPPSMSHKTRPFFPVRFPAVPLDQRNLSPAASQMVSQPPPILPPPTPPLVSTSMISNNVALGTPVMTFDQRRVIVEESTSTDYTKPFLSLLEHPIPKVAGVANGNCINLDLALKL